MREMAWLIDLLIYITCDLDKLSTFDDSMILMFQAFLRVVF